MKDISTPLKYYTDIPAPLPGPNKLLLTHHDSFQDYDYETESLLPKEIHTDIFEILDIDLVEYCHCSLYEPNLNTENTVDKFLRKNEYISSEYFEKQERRSEFLKLLRLKGVKKETNFFDYFSQSFLDLKETDGVPLKINDNKEDLYFTALQNALPEMLADDKFSKTPMEVGEYFIIEIEDENEAVITQVEKWINIK